MQIEVSAKDGCVWSSSSISVCFHDSTLFLARIASPHKLLMLCLLRTFSLAMDWKPFSHQKFPSTESTQFPWARVASRTNEEHETPSSYLMQMTHLCWWIYIFLFLFAFFTVPPMAEQKVKISEPEWLCTVGEPTIDFHTQFPQLQLFWFPAFPSVFTTA